MITKLAINWIHKNINWILQKQIELDDLANKRFNSVFKLNWRLIQRKRVCYWWSEAIFIAERYWIENGHDSNYVHDFRLE